MSQNIKPEGLKIRKEILGAEFVEKRIAEATEFNRPLQELVTNFAFGDVWSRPGLDRKTRSMLTLAMLAALNRPNEFKLHVRGAINNGVSKTEIREVLVHASVYAGVPAAVDGFRLAAEALKELGLE